MRLRPLSLVLHRCCTATRGRSLGHRTARTGSVDMTRLCDTVRSLNESMPSEAALPGFDPDLAHGEVLHVCGGQGSRDPNCCRSDETVGLVQCGSRCGKVAAPGSGEAAFGDAERSQSKAAKKPHRMGFLVGVEPTPDLLDRDGAYPRLSSQASQAGDPVGDRAPSKRVDEHGRVEE